MNISRWLPLLLVLTSGATQADDLLRVNLVKDLNTAPEAVSSNPHGFYAFNGRVYFSAYRQDVGIELFSTDGVSPDATLVADLLPGPAEASPAIMGSAGGRLILYTRTADDDNYQLVSFDPSTGQHTPLTAFTPSNNPGFSRLRDVAGRVLLEGAANQSLWSTDGTPAGTVELLPDGVETGGYHETCVLGGEMLFGRRGSSLEVWRSDGTAAGTQRVQALAESGTAVSARVTGDTCRFLATRAPTGWGVWHTDGTSAGTGLDRESAEGSPGLLGPAVDKTFFFAFGGGTVQLYRLDQAQPLVASPGMGSFAVAGGYALYTLPTNDGHEVLVHDGSSAAPRTVTLDGGPLLLSQEFFSSLSTVGELLFARSNSRLYHIDPAAATATRIADDVYALFEYEPGLYTGGVAYFLGGMGTSGYEVFRSDGTQGGTRLLHDIATATHGAIEGGIGFVQRGDVLYFIASEFLASSWMRGVARSDGTDAGTQWLPRTVIGNQFSASDLHRFAGGIAFSGFDPSVTSGSTALFHVDPLFTQTTPLAASGPAPSSFFSDDNLLVYGCNAPASTSNVVCALHPGHGQPTQIAGAPYSGNPFTTLDLVAGALVYFDQGSLWRTDGTVPGTYALANLFPWHNDQAPPMSYLQNVQHFMYDGRLYFQACTGWTQSTCGLYATDGTATPVLLAAVNGYVTTYTTYQGRLVFATDEGSAGQLWTSAGTPQTTHAVMTTPNYLYSLAEAGGLLHFTGWNGTEYRYYVTNMTAAGTREVSLPILISQSDMWEFDGNVVFGCYGICVVDGAGTGLQQRITAPEYRGFMARLPDAILFRGDDGFHGAELWRLSRNTDTIFADGFDG